MRISARSFPLATMARASRRSRAVRDETFHEKKRTWTLVALKAATRPTKEEARSADIIVVSECAGMTIESIARAGSIASRTTSCGLVLVLYTQTLLVKALLKPYETALICRI